MISVVVPALNGADLTSRCIATVREHSHTAEVVLVDNGSTDHTHSLDGRCDIVVRNATNKGFGRACNQGAVVSSGRTVVVLNNDTEVTAGWLEPLADAAQEYGIAGAKLVYPNGLIQHAGVDLDDPGGMLTATNRGRGQPDQGFDSPCDVDAVTGACLAIRRDVFARAGGFDLGYWNGYEDVDLCLTARGQGARVRYVPDSRVVHLESASGAARWTHVNHNVRRLQHRWGDRWRSSPKKT